MTNSILIMVLLLVVVAAYILITERRYKSMNTRLGRLVISEVNGLFNQMESYHYLRDRLNLRQGMPYTRDWSASPDFLKIIVEHSLNTKPEVVMECSSGLTTLMLARCCEMSETGQVLSLENGAEYVASTRGHVQRYGLQQRATVIDAPLQKYRLNDVEYDWYATDELPDQSIDMLVIDGPPGFIQKHSRYPALPLLFDKLADDCVIFLDDAARDDEKAIVAMWQTEFPGLQHQYINTERGCSVLTVRR